jgi:hypothetical protein
MHIRVYCDAEDVRLGCREIGPKRWFKKGYKYRDRVRPGALAWALKEWGVGTPRRTMMAALPALPFRGFVPR